jgi:hypothetical protein
MTTTKKADLRDWVAAGGTWDQLKAMIDTTPVQLPAAAHPVSLPPGGDKPPQLYSMGLILNTQASIQDGAGGIPRRSFEDLDNTVIGDAEFFQHMHASKAMYCGPWRKWLVWDGARWEIDDSGSVIMLAKETVLESFSQGQQ